MNYLTEEEQVERLRAWWKEYGLAVVSGIVIAIIIVLVWHYYTAYEARKSQAASLIYTTLVNSDLSEQPESAHQAAKELVKHYAGTPYASYAALWLAKQSVVNQQYPKAINWLNWVVANGKVKAVKQVARLRLAQINLQLNQPTQALQILATVEDKAYLGLIDETRGDAFLLANNISAAKTAYEQALQEMPEPDRVQPILAMKLANLPTSN
ncbi:MAG: hypothetical protein A3E87_08240 [Gammaproteobacteria bacterium RIFCSPHIGHO2_12_FULL_35_23]|nr:MAG: hypothetical protein A3E87_08240 [Gammaproteobacteria bacterium RIFCSPHIGHO2_12_FULL_35_23]